jgi:uncharacterized protein DUF4123
VLTVDSAAVVEALFGALSPGESLYALLDAARSHEIPLRLRTGGVHHDCLYEGPSAGALWFVAPYLARCERDSAFVSWLIEAGWGRSWGAFVAASGDQASLRQHFRKFILVKKAGDEADFYFRFYDPRVLRAFLPACAREEASEFFGPARVFIAEDPQASGAVAFTLTPGGVARAPLSLAPSGS